ncbi:MAG: AAA family ATPase, partial [Cyanobacteria bacterium REEB65]|nr:AAA family ATPase [Cyanobacteria bacterium REEB65]
LPTALIGRQAELAALEGLLAERRSSGSTAVLRIAGPSGVGKDRLVAELRARLQVEGGRFVEVHCEPGGAAFHPLERALRVVAPGAVAPWNDPSLLESPAFIGAVAAKFGALLGASPLVLHLADWHHADEASCALVDQLEAARPDGEAVFVLTDRQAAPGKSADLAVAPLDPAATRLAAQSMLGGTPIHDELATELFRLSQGNPLFLQGILTQLLTRDLLEQGPEGCRSRGSLAGQALPASLTAVLLAQLAECSDAARAIAQTLAVLGRPAQRALLAEATATGNLFVTGLSELEAASIVCSQTTAASAAEIAFCHGAMSEAIVGSLAFSRANEVHSLLLSALERQGAADDPTAIEERARHALACDPAERGIRYGLLAARHYLSRYALESARQTIEACLAALPDGSPLAGDFGVLLADADRHAGR